jgi:hypothetical protein
MMGVKKELSSVGTTSATMPLLPRARWRAALLGMKPSAAAASRTRATVAPDTISGRLSARDAVALDTRARAATSASVATRAPSGRPILAARPQPGADTG